MSIKQARRPGPGKGQARVEPGVPTGGQFAASARDEAEVSLDPDAVRDDFAVEEFGGDLDAAADAWLAQNDPDDDGFDRALFDADEADRAGVERAIDHAYESARFWEHHKGVVDRSRGVVDSDDIAQEALLSVLAREANGITIANPKAYMHTFAWGIAQQAGNHGVRQENRKALKMFNAEVERQGAALGRPLTSKEEDAIVASIRENWHDQRRKPSVDFRRFAGQMEISMSAQESPDAAAYLLPDSTLGRPGEDDPHMVLPGSYMDRSLSALEGDGGVRAVRRMLWNALAERSPAGRVPLVTPGTLSQRRVTTARAAMKDQPGGVLAAARDWEEGGRTEATDALFAPFGADLDQASRDAVVQHLRVRPEFAETLWLSACQLANSRTPASA